MILNVKLKNEKLNIQITEHAGDETVLVNFKGSTKMFQL